MERLRQLVSNIAAQLSVLSLSQRIAIGLAAALIAVSLLSLVQWAKTPDLVPLVDHSFEFVELSAIEDSLRAAGIDYEIVGNSRVLVRAADRHNALRLVYEADALPDGSLFDMQTVVTTSNPFQPPEARTNAWTYAKGNELAKIIITSPYVKKASVILNPVTKRRLGGITDVPTASVAVTLVRGQEMTQEMVETLAKLVAGAVGGLRPHNVNITDARTLRSFGVPNPEDATGFDILTMVKQREAHYKKKILDKLSHIPGIRVAVTVDIDMTKRVTQNIRHDLPQPRTESSQSTDQSSARRGTEPGTQANLGTAITVGAGGQSSTSEESSVENFEPRVAQTETIEQFPYSTNLVTAAVGIPRSFIVGVYLAGREQGTAEPKDDDPDFISLSESQIERVHNSVERIIMAQSPEDVEVDIYPDFAWSADGSVSNRLPGEVALGQEQSSLSTATDLAEHYGPQVGLGVLALMSLFMVMRLARQASESVAKRSDLTAEPDTDGDDTILEVGSAPIGQAEVSEGALTGKEVDPETLRYQELGTEVSKMINDDPTGTADLIRRWLNEDK